MRKALIGILMAATVASPLAAQTAEESSEQGRGGFARAVRAATQDDGSRAERREQRQERREERMERGEERAASPDRQADREARRAARAEAQGQQAQIEQREAQRPRTWVGGVNRAIVEERRDEARDRQHREQARRDYRYGGWDNGGWGYDRGHYGGGWDRQWRYDRRYDWQRHRYANRGLYRPGRYYSPFSNRGYNRFSIGIQIGSPYYSDRHWIRDPWQYRLPPAYAGTRWVRYYDDVLLVDRYSGQVLDVIYNFFW